MRHFLFGGAAGRGGAVGPKRLGGGPGPRDRRLQAGRRARAVQACGRGITRRRRGPTAGIRQQGSPIRRADITRRPPLMMMMRGPMARQKAWAYDGMAREYKRLRFD